MDSATEIADSVRRRKKSATAVVEDTITRIEERNTDINAFVHVDFGSALEQARTIDEQIAERVDVRGLRAVWSPDLGFAPVEPEIVDTCAGALDALRRCADIELVSQSFRCTNVYHEWNSLAAIDMLGEFEKAGFLPGKLDRISPGPRQFIENSSNLPIKVQAKYRGRLVKLEREIAEVFATADLIITPTACCDAYAAKGPLPTMIGGRDASRTHAEPFTAIGSVCWNSSISVPAGKTASGLPVGLLLTGPRHRDDLLLRLARIWEQSNPCPRVAPAFAVG